MAFYCSHKKFLVKHIALIVFMLFPYTVYSANKCTDLLDPSINFPFEDWPIAENYRQLTKDVQHALEKNSVAHLVSLYFSFQGGFQNRYDLQMEALIENNPYLDHDFISLRKAMNSFYRFEEKVLSLFRSKILSFPAKKRMQYLKRLNTDKLKKHELLLDALMGLDLVIINHEISLELQSDTLSKKHPKYEGENIWYDEDGKHQTSYAQLIDLIELMNLKPGEIVSDLGSGLGRLGLLIGLLRPDVSFVGLELVEPRVKWSNEAARMNGFLNVKFAVANLADVNLSMPRADHFYLFNPTTPSSSDFLAERLIDLSNDYKFKIYILSQFQSGIIKPHFRFTQDGQFLVYAPF